MFGLIEDVKKSVIDYKSELATFKRKTLSINKNICNLDDVINSIQTSTQTQDHKIESLDTFNRNMEKFISDVIRADGEIADIINRCKDAFYNEYSYLQRFDK
jgi:hypothetical protein